MNNLTVNLDEKEAPFLARLHLVHQSNTNRIMRCNVFERDTPTGPDLTIGNFFLWDRTPEGHRFWSDTDRLIRKKL